jgi:hypothetical protein
MALDRSHAPAWEHTPGRSSVHSPRCPSNFGMDLIVASSAWIVPRFAGCLPLKRHVPFPRWSVGTIKEFATNLSMRRAPLGTSYDLTLWQDAGCAERSEAHRYLFNETLPSTGQFQVSCFFKFPSATNNTSVQPDRFDPQERKSPSRRTGRLAGVGGREFSFRQHMLAQMEAEHGAAAFSIERQLFDI